MSTSLSMDRKAIEDHPVVERYINYYKRLKEVKLFNHTLLWNVASSLIIAPFYTIAISRQLSVTPHKEIYGDYINPKTSKELTKISTEVTLRDARNFELVKQSGVVEGNKPYRAPIYDNYLQTIKGLYQQGILGFYKGNFWRLMTFSSVQRMKITLEWHLKEKYSIFSHLNFLRDFITLSICDMLLHPAFVIENRYILQNRNPQFQIYKNFLKFKLRSFDDFYKGVLSHIPKNFLFLSGFYLYYIFPTQGNFSLGYIIGSIFSYPVLTGLRRITCESSSLPGLLPVRYLNLVHAIFLIRREEGFFRGLYKGFFSYMIAITLWTLIVPANALFTYHLQKQQEEDQYFVNDPVFEEIKKRKLQNLRNSL